MNYPGYDPDPLDARYSDHPPLHGAAGDYYYNRPPYATELEIDDDSTSHHNSNFGYQEYLSEYGPGLGRASQSSYPSSYIGSGGHSSSWDEPRTRDMSATEYTNPDFEDSYFAQSGQRCIFHWDPIRCPQRFHGHDEWLEHLEDHFPPGRLNPDRPDFGDMPGYWNCGFKGCSFSLAMTNGRRDMWHKKGGHIYEHLLNDRVLPEKMPEDANWMKYYYKQRLCSEAEYRSFAQYPPHISDPYKKPLLEFRRPGKEDKKSRKRDLQEDALGERAPPAPLPQASYPQHMPPQGHYTHYQPGPPSQHQHHSPYHPPY